MKRFQGTAEEKKEHVRKLRAAAYQRNREKWLVRHAAYRHANKDLIRERNREYRAKNIDRYRELAKEHHIRHRERRNAKARARRVGKRDELNAWHAEYYKRNREYLLDMTNRYKLRRCYGMTPEDKDAMLESQGGGCAICGVSVVGKRKAHIDHDHGTGVVRGILCRACNSGLGHLQDSPAILASALMYLAKHKPVAEVA